MSEPINQQSMKAAASNKTATVDGISVCYLSLVQRAFYDQFYVL